MNLIFPTWFFKIQLQINRGLLTYCKKFACNAYHINSWFCGNFLKEAVCALLLKSFVMSVSARCIYRFVCTIALQTIHEIEILKRDLKPRGGQSFFHKGQLILKCLFGVFNFFQENEWKQVYLRYHSKGQLISNCPFDVFNFFLKTNKNTSHTNKNEFIRSFFGRIHLTICFHN